MKGFLLILFAFLSPQGFAQTPHLFSLPMAGPIVGNESWTDESAQSHRLQDWVSRYYVLTMAYSDCKKTCQLVTFRKLKEIQKAFDANGIAAQFVIVTFDPDHDTPEVLMRFRKHLGLDRENWHFLHGSEADTHAYASRIGLNDFLKMDDHIQHRFRIAIVDTKEGKTHMLDWNNQDVQALMTELSSA